VIILQFFFSVGCADPSCARVQSPGTVDCEYHLKNTSIYNEATGAAEMLWFCYVTYLLEFFQEKLHLNIFPYKKFGRPVVIFSNGTETRFN